MRRGVLIVALAVLIAGAAASVRPSEASAEAPASTWCWPSSCGYDWMGAFTSNYNNCYYSSGDVCSGWNFWHWQDFWRLNEATYPAKILFGYENSERIRGWWSTWYTASCQPCTITPSQVSMGGYLKGQNSWWGFEINDTAYIGPVVGT